jgi:hypothetical protein
MHIVYVDASAKVEQWTRDSAIAIADGIQASILVKGKVKGKARNWLRARYPNRRRAFYVNLLFSILIYLVAEPHLKHIGHLCIDADYTDQDQEIKSWLLHFLHRHDPTLRGEFISIHRVKGSKADLLAREIFEGKQTADRNVSLEEIVAVFDR